MSGGRALARSVRIFSWLAAMAVPLVLFSQIAKSSGNEAGSSEAPDTVAETKAPLPVYDESEIYGPPLPPPPPPPFPVIAQMGSQPDWSALSPFQRTITHDEFVHLLDHCYARKPEDYRDLIQIWPDRARIRKQSTDPEAGFYDLYFLSDRRKPADIPRYWRTPWEVPALPDNADHPLRGIHVAIDPGHIGGNWADEEGRYYKIGKDTIPVQEGDLTLRTAKLLARNLRILGATVSLTRTELRPVTDLRASDLEDDARAWLRQNQSLVSDSLVQRTAERFFYVSSEIRTRAEIVNTEIRPDLVLCLHYNASPWRNPYRPAFQSPNHFHLLINGCYSRAEIAEDDTRQEMLLRLLQRTYYYELALAHDIARTMADETRLPPASYNGNSGKSVSDDRYVWARNLLANRKYLCPVVFFEPYCMNHREVHARIQAGEYRGLKEFNGVYRKNIYQEYADGATAGIVNYFRRVRGNRSY
ncbi:MAG: N-acetylmuramoyl-L-alanine amidase [Verrucomicrobiae bacterium]|nr:N-acetylmuramoyl-L-alanine amidase [Verrucomicrobiae bacterium]